MKNEEYLIKLSLLQEEAKKLEEQFLIVNEEIRNMDILEKSIDELDDKEILFQIGKGVFVSNKNLKKLFVNVGSNVVLVKGKEETKEIIEKQKEEMMNISKNIEKQIENINYELEKIIEEAEKNKK